MCINDAAARGNAAESKLRYCCYNQSTRFLPNQPITDTCPTWAKLLILVAQASDSFPLSALMDSQAEPLQKVTSPPPYDLLQKIFLFSVPFPCILVSTPSMMEPKLN
jgi:hypothetical protein